MSLRELLDLCQDTHSDDWVLLPGNRPATAMLAGVFDPGMRDEARTRTLDGHSIAVYEPDPRLSMVWPVPEEPEAERPDRFERGLPDWAEEDSEEFKSARVAYTVILLGGAPVWQEAVWYLDWGVGNWRVRPVHRAGVQRRVRGARTAEDRLAGVALGGEAGEAYEHP